MALKKDDITSENMRAIREIIERIKTLIVSGGDITAVFKVVIGSGKITETSWDTEKEIRFE